MKTIITHIRRWPLTKEMADKVIKELGLWSNKYQRKFWRGGDWIKESIQRVKSAVGKTKVDISLADTDVQTQEMASEILKDSKYLE